MIFLRKLIIWFEHMIFSFENMIFPKKVNYLIRKYDLFIQEYAKVAPKLDELILGNVFGGSSLKDSFPKGEPNS